jgi:methylated-DNA-[protein]-cysteine S-methyltransferase
MKKTKQPYWVVVFPSFLGWMALLGEKNQIKELTFGHPSSKAAKKALSPDLAAKAQLLLRRPRLVSRLQDYAKGRRDDFRDVNVDIGHLNEFQRRVVALGRKIPFGSTISYGRLAAQAGSPRAARAAGSCMAGNKIPIIIPCHRVVYSNGKIGAYSAPGGTKMKKHLLTLENPSRK